MTAKGTIQSLTEPRAGDFIRADDIGGIIRALRQLAGGSFPLSVDSSTGVAQRKPAVGHREYMMIRVVGAATTVPGGSVVIPRWFRWVEAGMRDKLPAPPLPPFQEWYDTDDGRTSEGDGLAYSLIDVAGVSTVEPVLAHRLVTQEGEYVWVFIPTAYEFGPPAPGRIVAADLFAPNRWLYTIEPMFMGAVGPNGWVKSNANNPALPAISAYNLAEIGNTAAGVQGNGVNVTNLPAGFTMRPIALTGRLIVYYPVRVRDNPAAPVQYWICEPNAVDGVCS